MKIGIDIDGVLCDQILYIVKEAKKRYGITIDKNLITRYAIHEFTNLTHEQLMEIFTDSTIIGNVEIINDANIAVNELYKYYEIHLVTARPLDVKEATIQWLSKHNFKYDRLAFTQNKKAYTLQHKLDYFIEDRYKTVLDLSTNCLGIFLFDYPWNRRKIPKNIKRVTSWDEILKTLQPKHPKIQPLYVNAKHWTSNIWQYNTRMRNDYSQTGESGALQYIFDNIKFTNNVMVEFGAGDGSFLSNTKFFEIKYGTLRKLFDVEPKSKFVIKAKITVENVNTIFEQNYVPASYDLLSIDVDGNDYWIWKAIKYNARVVIIEYNQSLGYKESKTIKYNPDHIFDRTIYYGASIEALKKLGLKKGYTLVHINGLNAFFIRADLLENFKGLHYPVIQLKPGWPLDTKHREWIEV
jgi:uncharacterized HAD superfamily protein